ncbi:internal virion protein [Klebsiella phage KN1-1]|uniref:Internal virion protein gp15 n=1 Tax=Klebsiella phage KN1-1 TaxID=2282629 RepID=A0A3Q9WQN5_BPKN1|nr:internal virion protein [Klebsiella phage KN1-1]BBF66842.1 putative internal virion protein C [Klebsiella phage KN1-1]
MASKLEQALGQLPQAGSTRIRGGSASMQYRPVTIQQEGVRQSNLVQSLAKFGAAMGEAADVYDKRQRDKAEERSDEIIRKLTPEQRREAIKNGTLLYQDDPYAMEALRFKTGRNAAFLIDDEVAQRVQNGEFRTRAEMEEYRHKRLTEGANEFAEQFMINPEDSEFQRGFNANITERNISLYGKHDTFLSEQAQKGAILASKVELSGVLKDPQVLARPESGEFFQRYIDNAIKTGSIPSDAQAQQVIIGSLNDVIQRPGATNFLQSLEDRPVTLNGKTTTYKELMGEEQWNALMVKAQSTQFDNDAKLSEGFRLGITSALNQDDTSKGWEMLQGAKAELDRLQPGEQMTPERERLIQAEEQMQARFRQEAQAAAKEMDKRQKTINKNQVIDQQFTKRINGQYVSTSYKDMPTNENTGEFTHSDMVNYANGKLAEIDQMQLTEQQKDRMKLSYLRADSEGGAFRTVVGQMVTDAGSEWSAAVINGKLPEDTTALNKLRTMRNTDPDLFAALYPDKADLFLTMDMMDKQGIDPQILIDADRSRRSLTKEMQYEDDKAWASLKNNSESPELSRIPASLDGMARKIYDSVKYRTGNSDMAMQQTDKFLKESTVTFKGDDVDGDTIGIIPKNILQVSDDPKSWEQGRDILEEARKGIIAANPWVTNKQLTMYQQGDSIYMMDTTGTVRIRYDKELLTRTYQEQQQRLAKEAEEKALKEATKRAPISAATQARKAAGERVRAKRKATPKFIYGGGDE